MDLPASQSRPRARDGRTGPTRTVSFRVRTTRTHNDHPPGVYTLRFHVRGSRRVCGYAIFCGNAAADNVVSSITSEFLNERGVCAWYESKARELCVTYRQLSRSSYDCWGFRVLKTRGVRGARRATRASARLAARA